MKTRLQSILLFAIITGFFNLAKAQSVSGVVRGVVMDNNKQPVPFASVIVKGTT